MKHSLGPYRFEGNKIVCAAGYNVATVNSHATSEGRATGKLLAAAPDMADEIKKQIDWLKHARAECAGKVRGSLLTGFDQSIKYLTAVLAEARG